jgi:hypothetical protein
MTTVRPREREALMQALRAGVVPRTGQYLIQVGRLKEIEGLLKDIAGIADGGTALRLIVGEYGSGKTFFLNLVRSMAMAKNLVTASADLNPDRRLHGTKGQARSLYAELIKNLSTRNKPDGGALAGIVETFIFNAETEAQAKGVDLDRVIRGKLARLSEMVNGYDFAKVIGAYCSAHVDGNQDLQENAIRWLRGEFATKTDARSSLGVRVIVDDANYYDQLKLMSLFFRLAGYSGFLICLDEMVNLYKLSNPQARNANYEQILRIVNDTLQGDSQGLGFLLGGTPEFLTDTRRGLYSYTALQSRLEENTFAKGANLVDYNHPVLRLSSLTPDDFLELLGKIQLVFVFGDETRVPLPDEALVAFMNHCHERVGDAYFRTPRTTIRAWVNLLSILEQNPGIDWRVLLGQTVITKDLGEDQNLAFENEVPGLPATVDAGDDKFASFTL